MDEKAKLGNSSDRTTTAKIGNGFDVTPGLGTTPFKIAPQLDINSTSAATGVGNVDRSEKIALSVAAVVTGLLPDGNMLISGSQEMRVNDELRIVNVAGVVRPARHHQGEHHRLRPHRRGAHLLRRPRAHERGAAAGLGSPALRRRETLLSGT